MSSVVPVAMHLPLFGRLVRSEQETVTVVLWDCSKERALAGFAELAAYRCATDGSYWLEFALYDSAKKKMINDGTILLPFSFAFPLHTPYLKRKKTNVVKYPKMESGPADCSW